MRDAVRSAVNPARVGVQEDEARIQQYQQQEATTVPRLAPSHARGTALLVRIYIAQMEATEWALAKAMVRVVANAMAMQ